MPKRSLTKHIVMRFDFPGFSKAWEFIEALKRLDINIPAEIDRESLAGRGRWRVKTDTRCLEHADALLKYVYGKKGKEGA
jgi:hypothetical protein